MSERLITIADAVVDLINSATWSQEFTAVRSAVPRYEAKDGTLEVKVRPFGRRTVGRVGRKKIDREYMIDVVVAKKVEIADNDQTDPLIDLAEEIAAWFEADDAGDMRVVLSSSPRAWVSTVESVASAYAWEYAVADQFVAVRRVNVKSVE